MQGHDGVAVETMPQEVLARIRAAYHSLSSAEQRVADAFDEHAAELVQMPVKDLAQFIGVSEATIIRCCQSLGYRGLRDLKLALATETLVPNRVTHEAVRPDDSIQRIISKALHADMQAIVDTLAIIDSDALEQAVAALLAATRIEFYGVQSSMPVAFSAYQRFLRIGMPVTYAGQGHLQALSAAQLSPGAVAFAISRSGFTPEIRSALRNAKRAGATCILLTSHANTPIGEFADIQLMTAARNSIIRSGIIESRISHVSLIDALSVVLVTLRPDETRLALARMAEQVAELEIRD